jgi:hypothetical protein
LGWANHIEQTSSTQQSKYDTNSPGIASANMQRFRKVIWICGLSRHPIFSRAAVLHLTFRPPWVQDKASL